MVPRRVLGGSMAVSICQHIYSRFDSITKGLENEGDGWLVQLYYPPYPVVGTICSHSGYRDSILQSDIYLWKVRPLPYLTNIKRVSIIKDMEPFISIGAYGRVFILQCLHFIWWALYKPYLWDKLIRKKGQSEMYMYKLVISVSHPYDVSSFNISFTHAAVG